MDLLVNDRSIHGQFDDPAAFRSSLGNVMAIRNVARAYGRDLRCDRRLPSAFVTPSTQLVQAVNGLTRDEQRAVMQWLTTAGPFWEDEQRHDAGEYFECDDDVVSASAIAEAAAGRLRGDDVRLVSFAPSDWLRSPLRVIWRTGRAVEPSCEVANYWRPDEVKAALDQAPVPISSWDQLRETALQRFHRLSFARDSFEPLRGFPFAAAAATRILTLLGALDAFAGCFDEGGQRTAEGQRIYSDYFTGDRAWFSDSSASEKADFAKELTFAHPDVAGENLFCPWHGKVNTPLLRLHFSWPVRAADPIYIVYVGQKITRR